MTNPKPSVVAEVIGFAFASAFVASIIWVIWSFGAIEALQMMGTTGILAVCAFIASGILSVNE